MGSLQERLAAIVDTDAWLAYTLDVLLPNLVVATLVFVGFWFLLRALSRGLAGVCRRAKLDETAARFSQTLLKYTVLTIGTVSALAQLGVNMVSIVTSLGVAGITIGFAARDALSNVISGFFIFIDRPFVIGDLIEVGPHYGRVDNITMRSTRVVTPDGRMLAVPNTEILNSTVASYTNFPHLRLDLPVTIGVNEDVGRVRQVLLDLVRDDEHFMSEPSPAVVLTALNDYNIGVELRVWIQDERNHIIGKADLREAMLSALRRADVEMPFETIALAPITLERGPETQKK